MPRFFCAAKRQIKETVISSTASAADSYVAVVEGASGAGEEVEGILQQSVKEEIHGKRDEGEEKGKDRATHCGSTPLYKVLQLSRTLWRETQTGRGRWD